MSTIILNDDNPRAICGRKIRLTRPCGTFTHFFPIGKEGTITDVSESGAIWVDTMGWIRPEWAEYAD